MTIPSTIRRRAVLQAGLVVAGSATAAVARAERPAPDGAGTPDLEEIDLRWARSRGLSRRALVLVPRGISAAQKPAGLLLLHGLGETSSEDAGIRAWIDRYGLMDAYRRLLRPPVAPINTRGDLPEDRARALNDSLSANPFTGNLVFVCPYIPNVHRLPSTSVALDEMARWTEETLVPEVRSRTPLGSGPLGVDGCSLGGFVGIELFVRRPTLFRSWGGVQGAFSRAAAPGLASRVAAAVGMRRPPLHVETSTGDPFRDANVALARALSARNLPCEVEIFPGPHDQPWLREVGTLAMLLFHDRSLRG